MAESISQRISQQYPFLAFLANDPEVGPLLQRAVSLTTPYSAERFTSELLNTSWWRTRSDSQREWAVITNTRPAEANQRRASFRAGLNQNAKAFGTNLSANELRFITEVALQNGWDPAGPEITAALGKTWSFLDRGKGQVGAARKQVETLARQYFLENSIGSRHRAGRAHLDSLGLRIAMGQDNIEAVQGRMADLAAKRFPHMADMIKSGMTVAEIIQPHRQLVAEEMELGNAENVDVVKSPVWRQLLGVRDPKSGGQRMMTDSEVIKLARQQDAWWRTNNGRQADNAFADTILNVFGKRKSSMGSAVG